MDHQHSICINFLQETYTEKLQNVHIVLRQGSRLLICWAVMRRGIAEEYMEVMQGMYRGMHEGDAGHVQRGA